MKDGILRILPALLHESGRGLTVVCHEPGFCRIAVLIDPAQCALNIWPDRRDELKVAAAHIIGVGKHDEERRGIHAAVVLPEGDFTERGHFAMARFVEDLAGFRVSFGYIFSRLCGGEKPEHAPSHARIDPKHLQRRDQTVPSKRRTEPGYA